jgi:hypothetical protein
MRMLFGQIALNFTHSLATKSPVRDFIIAKPMLLCGSIGASNKQRNKNDPVGPTLTANHARYCTRAGSVTEQHRSLSALKGGMSLCASSS